MWSKNILKTAILSFSLLTSEAKTCYDVEYLGKSKYKVIEFDEIVHRNEIRSKYGFKLYSLKNQICDNSNTETYTKKRKKKIPSVSKRSYSKQNTIGKISDSVHGMNTFLESIFGPQEQIQPIPKKVIRTQQRSPPVRKIGSMATSSPKKEKPIIYTQQTQTQLPQTNIDSILYSNKLNEYS
ncbi:hypothetical protein HN415_02125, partial [Candidatus Woesearchaeota archaeon]|nr:hypothetical protein [Candidatus Woesearchaeota archaeon]